MKFQIGDKVNMRSFENCFKVETPDYLGFTVTDIKTIESPTYPTYRRITASKDGVGTIEGAERFFSEGV